MNTNITKTIRACMLVSITALCSCAGLNPAETGATGHAVSLMYGQQAFADSRIENDVRADVYGVQFEYTNPGTSLGDVVLGGEPLVSEAGFLFGTTDTETWLYTPGGGTVDGVPVGLDTYEVYAGLRKDWRLGRVTPFLGAGVSLTLADVDAFEGHDQDVKLGGYAKAGARLTLTESLSVGAEARYRLVDDFEVSNSLGTIEGDLSGLAGLLSLTWSF